MIHTVERFDDFVDGARYDWLHPSHGRFPDLACIMEDDNNGDRFEILVWDCCLEWVVAACGPDKYHNGFPRSYRWYPNQAEPTSISCSPTKGDVYEVDIEWTTEEDVLNQVARASAIVHRLTEPRR